MTSIPVSPADPLAALRAATGSLHARLDAALPLAQADATLSDYVLHLRVLVRWFDAIAPTLGLLRPDPVAVPDLASLRRLALDDLRLAGVSTIDVPSPAEPEGAHAGAGPSVAAAWGLAYVLAGSQLGGQVLYRRLQAPLSPHPLNYLAGTGLAADAGTRWKAFMAGLRAALDTPQAVAAASTAAVAAFEALLALFAAEGLEVAA